MTDDKARVPSVEAGQFDVLYINRSGKDLHAEVIARGTTGGFNTVADTVTTPRMADLVVDLRRVHDQGNAVRIRIPDSSMLVGWGGEEGINYRFRVLD